MHGEFEAMYFKAMRNFFETSTAHAVMNYKQDIIPKEVYEKLIKPDDKKVTHKITKGEKDG